MSFVIRCILETNQNMYSFYLLNRYKQYKSKYCSFGLPRVPFVKCCQVMYLVISLFGFEGRIWDLIVSVSDHCSSF